MNTLLLTSPNRKRAISLVNAAKRILKRAKGTDKIEYSSEILKDYYEIIRVLMSAMLILEGKRVLGEGAHKEQIAHFKENYSFLKSSDIELIEHLRILRNKISYDGYFVKNFYLERKEEKVLAIIDKLMNELDKVLS